MIFTTTGIYESTRGTKLYAHWFAYQARTMYQLAKVDNLAITLHTYRSIASKNPPASISSNQVTQTLNAYDLNALPRFATALTITDARR